MELTQTILTPTKMENLTREEEFELQFNTARNFVSDWVTAGCNKTLKLKFYRGIISCSYNGVLKFSVKSGLGTGKELSTHYTLTDAIKDVQDSGWFNDCLVTILK
jgi:hypothetical protein